MRLLTLLISLCALALIGGSAGQSLTGDGSASTVCQFGTPAKDFTNTNTGNSGCWLSHGSGSPTTCGAVNSNHCPLPAGAFYQRLVCNAPSSANTNWGAGDFYVAEVVETNSTPDVAHVATNVHSFTVKFDSGCTQDDATICLGSEEGYVLNINKTTQFPSATALLASVRISSINDATPGAPAPNIRMSCRLFSQ